MRHDSSADIPAPRDEVWEVLADVERWPEWTPTVRRLEVGALTTGLTRSSLRTEAGSLRERCRPADQTG